MTSRNIPIVNFLENKTMNKDIEELDKILSQKNYLMKEHLLNKFYPSELNNLSVLTHKNIQEGSFINPFSNKKVDIIFDKENTSARHYQLSIHRNLDTDKIFYSAESFLESFNYYNKYYHLNFMPTPNDKYNLFKDFVINHELAHLSLLQKSFVLNYEKDHERKHHSEIHSDISSIMKTSKDWNLSSEQIIDFCNSIIVWRVGKYNLLEVFLANEKKEIPIKHATDTFLIHFKEFLKSDDNINFIKSLSDSEITAFANLMVNIPVDNDIIIRQWFNTNSPSKEDILYNLKDIKDLKFEKATFINMEILKKEGHNLDSTHDFFKNLANKANTNHSILHSLSIKSILLVEGKNVKEYLSQLSINNLFNTIIDDFSNMKKEFIKSTKKNNYKLK